MITCNLINRGLSTLPPIIVRLGQIYLEMSNFVLQLNGSFFLFKTSRYKVLLELTLLVHSFHDLFKQSGVTKLV